MHSSKNLEIAMIWKNCICDIYYTTDAAELNDPGYEVRIDGEVIVLSYESETGWVNYRGRDTGGGHYLLTAPEVKGRGMLHRLPDAEILEGNWEEDGCHGMWRVYLIE
jgi:hypothetical protein